MTFYEAALRVLEAAGRPLHFQEITERSIQKSLLSHVGKTPELTMLSRLLAMARRKTDRKVVVVTKDTFALADWALPEEPEALAQTALSETREEDNLPPLRPAERHPEPRAENVRVAGRGTERKRRREDEDEGRRRKKRFPPVAEVAFEILSESGGGLAVSAIAERARERELAGELQDVEILTALLEDNQRRIDAGRRPQFVFDDASATLSLEAAGAAEAPALDIQTALAAAAGVPMENGRPMLARPTRPAAATAEAPPELVAANASLKSAAREARRAAARALRKRLSELDAGTFEKTMVKVLHAEGFRELKVARRGREGALLVARRRDGSLELRYAVRVLRGQAVVERKTVQELRRDLGHHGAHVGLIATPGEVRGDARSEATNGQLVFLWCGDALADRYLDAEVGVTALRHAAYEIDERVFEVARAEAEDAQRRREERLRDRDRGGGRSERREEPRREEPIAAAATPFEEVRPEEALAETATETALAAVPADGPDEDDDEEGEDEAPGAASAPSSSEGLGQPPGERKRRRRRRRGRRGKGRPGEGTQPGGGAAPDASAPGAAPAAAASADAPPDTAARTDAPASSAPSAPEPAPPPPPPPPGEGSAP